MLRTSLVLASVALGLLLFIVFFERGSLSTTEREGRKGRVLESFVRDRVTRLEIQRKGVDTVLVRVPADPDDQFDVGGWRVEQPYRAKADHNAVDSLIGALEWVDARRSLGEASAAELQQFGLATPRYRVKFSAGRDESGFSLGAPAADGGGVYLQLRGKPSVYVVGKELLEALDHEPSEFHDKQLHEGITVHTLTALSLRGADGVTRKIARHDAFDWLEEPYTSLVSAPALAALIDALDALRATRFVTEAPLPAQALDAPRFTLVLNSKVYDTKVKGKRIDEQLAFRVGAACAGHAAESYLRVNEGPVFCAMDSELAKLDKPADELRETRLLPLEDSAISGVQVRSGGREVKLEITDKETRYSALDHGREQQAGVADAAALSEWYSALRAVQIESFGPLDAATRGRLESSGATATFQRGKDAAPYVVHIASDGMTSVASRLTEASLLHVPNLARELLTPDVARFRKKRVLDESELEFSSLTSTRADHAVESVAKTQAGYQLSEPVLAPADRTAVDELVRLVSKLDALRYVADRALAEYGFAEPYRTLRVEYAAAGARRVHTLVIAAASGELGRYARLDSDPAVFVVPNALVHKLEDSLVSRSAVSLPRARVQSLEVIAGAKRLHVEKDVAGFTVAGSGETGRARADKLLQTLATLSATRAPEYEDAKPGDGFDHPALKLVARLSDPAATVTWSFAEAGADSVRVRRSDLPLTFAVPKAVLDALLERSAHGDPG